MSSIQRYVLCPQFRGVLIKGFQFRGVLIKGSQFRGVLIKGFHCIPEAIDVHSPEIFRVVYWRPRERDQQQRNSACQLCRHQERPTLACSRRETWTDEWAWSCRGGPAPSGRRRRTCCCYGNLCWSDGGC